LKFIRTRIAPTPSGYLHLGNAYAFALTAGLASLYGAKLMLRIDDMDRQRMQPQFIDDIFESLKFLQIYPDEGPADAADFEQRFSQRLRQPLYDEALAKLAQKGLVYACSCSRSEAANGCVQGCKARALALHESGYSWRLDTSNDYPLRSKRLAESEEIVHLPEAMRDFVVRRKDGYPAYQVCSLVDDLHFEVDLIVRGNDLLASTAAQLYLAECLEMPAFSEKTFLHHNLLLNADGAKLSKSAGSTSLQHLRAQGMSTRELYATLGELANIPTPVCSYADLAAAYALP